MPGTTFCDECMTQGCICVTLSCGCTTGPNSHCTSCGWCTGDCKCGGCCECCSECGGVDCTYCEQCDDQSCNCETCGNCGEHESDCDCCSECGSTCTCCCSCNNECPRCEYSGFDRSCENCGHEDNPSGPNEGIVARARGVNTDRDVAENCADYYLLNHMVSVSKFSRAYTPLHKLCNALAPEFATYLDMACGGELRHADLETVVNDDRSSISGTPPGHRGNSRGSRGGAWEAWTTWTTPIERAQYAVDAFGYGHKKSDADGLYYHQNSLYAMIFPSPGYGGAKWIDISRTLHTFLEGGVSNISFVDRVWNLQHNGGRALNKSYSGMSRLENVLNAHGADDYETLIAQASNEVRALWMSHDEWKSRTMGMSDRMDVQAHSLSLIGAERAVGAYGDPEVEEAAYRASQAAENSVWHQAYGNRPWSD